MLTQLGPLDDVSVSQLLDERPRHNEIAYAVCKRMMDMIVAALALLLLSPVLLLAAVAIKLTDWGPVLFMQTRVGQNGEEFQCYKLRSMVVDAEARKGELAALSHHTDERTFKIPKDPRITWIGSLIRKSSIDELPQLWNVVRGDMSIVGPRPPLPSEVALYTPRDLRRLEVRPGLTCTWQVSGRGDLPFERQVALDVEYIENRSLWFDLKLVAQTIPAVLSGRGAY